MVCGRLFDDVEDIDVYIPPDLNGPHDIIDILPDGYGQVCPSYPPEIAAVLINIDPF